MIPYIVFKVIQKIESMILNDSVDDIKTMTVKIPL